MEHNLRVRITSYHVHVNDGLDPLRELGFRVQQGNGALDLGRPDEADRPRRTWQSARGDEFLQGSRDLENRNAATGVVIRSGPLVIEVTREGDLRAFEPGVRPLDACRDHFVESGVLSCPDARVQPDVLAL